VVLVPGLIAVMSLSQREATANSLLAIIPISAVGVAVYYLAGSAHQVRFDIGLVLAVASVLGALLGARIAHRVSDRTLRVAFGILAIVVAIRLLIPISV
jgi:uncharacterized membrane protein YfcA